MTLLPWQQLELTAVGTHALVVGNGPGRLGLEPVLRRWRGPIIACNSYWRTGLPIDYLVVYDAEQADLALENFAGRIVMRQQIAPGRASVLHGDPCADPRLCNRAKRRTWLAEPLVSAVPDSLAVEHWSRDPMRMAIATKAGHVAYQLAGILGAESVTLAGIDACVAGDEESACARSWPGYEIRVTVGDAVERPGSDGSRVTVPARWLDDIELWRVLTRDLDLPTTRLGARPTALSWIPSLAEPDLLDRLQADDRG